MTLILPTLPATDAPPDENARLDDLHSLGILGSGSDHSFDEHTRLLQSALGLPMSAVVLVDRELVHIKARRGSKFTPVPRCDSFANHALLEDRVFVVTDASADPRFVSHPDVCGGPRIRFWAGAVIHGPKGQGLGVICVMDQKPRKLETDQVELLLGFARLIERTIAQEAAAQERQQRIAATLLHDRVTGLPSERLFLGKLQEFLTRENPKSVMLAVVLLDRLEIAYKAAGKAGVSYVASEAVRRIRQTAGEPNHMGCFREDMLWVALPIKDLSSRDDMLRRLTDAFQAPFSLGEHRFIARVRIGAAVSPADADDAERLLKRARTALPRRSSKQTSQYRTYSRELSEQATRYFQIESALKGASDRDEFRLVYQPKFESKGLRLVGAEALLRWRTAELGSVSPTEFIPVAEESGLSVDIGAWVIEEACKQLAAWRNDGRDVPEISVNVSSYHLLDRDFRENVRTALARAHLPGDYLNLEITESSLVNDTEAAIDVMHQIRGMGVKFSIDDFGKGYSCLGYLRRMPINVLKIDKQFIVDVSNNPRDQLLVQSIVQTGRALDLIVVAEGIERPEQLDFLQRVDCDQVQGFLLSPPIAPSDFATRFGASTARSGEQSG